MGRKEEIKRQRVRNEERKRQKDRNKQEARKEERDRRKDKKKKKQETVFLRQTASKNVSNWISTSCQPNRLTVRRTKHCHKKIYAHFKTLVTYVKPFSDQIYQISLNAHTSNKPRRASQSLQYNTCYKHI